MDYRSLLYSAEAAVQHGQKYSNNRTLSSLIPESIGHCSLAGNLLLIKKTPVRHSRRSDEGEKHLGFFTGTTTRNKTRGEISCCGMVKSSAATEEESFAQPGEESNRSTAVLTTIPMVVVRYSEEAAVCESGRFESLASLLVAQLLLLHLGG